MTSIDPMAFASASMSQVVGVRADLPVSPFKALEIPAEFGQVTDTVLGGASAPALIHIQSAHGSYDAEKNIEKLLEYIEKNSSVKLMLLEGAAAKLQPELFRLFPNQPDFNRKVTGKLMQEGYLTGPEVFMIEGDHKNRDLSLGTRDSKKQGAQTSPESRVPRSTGGMQAYGIEDLSAYKKDREAFIKVVKKEKTAEKFLGSLRVTIDKRFSAKLNKDLLNLVRQEEAFGSGTVSFEGWLKTLGEGSKKHLKTDLSDAFYQDQYPSLIRYFRLQAIGSKINRDKALVESESFLRELEKRGIAKEILQLFKTGLGTSSSGLAENKNASLVPSDKSRIEGYSSLRLAFDAAFEKLPKDFSMSAWPHWTLYAQHLILMQEMESKGLHEETVRLKDKIQTALAKTPDEKAYLVAARQLYLLRRLFALELTRAEYEELQTQRGSYLGTRTSRGTTTSPESLVPSPEAKALFAAAMLFYSTAVVRENKMFENALNRMSEAKQQRAVIVTGGFHAEGLKALAASKGCSYLQITPRISEISKRDHEVYLRSILGTNDRSITTEISSNVNIQEGLGTRTSGIEKTRNQNESLVPSHESLEASASQMSMLLGLVGHAERVAVTGIASTQDWAFKVRGLVLGMINSEEVSARSDLFNALSRSFLTPVWARGNQQGIETSRIAKTATLNPHGSHAAVRRSAFLKLAAAMMFSLMAVSAKAAAGNAFYEIPTNFAIASLAFQMPLQKTTPDEQEQKFQKALELLKDQDPLQRRFAGWTLSEMKDIRAIPALIGTLNDEDPEVRFSALKALGELKDPRVVQPLIEFLKTNYYGRPAAAEGLGKSGDLRAVPALIEAIKDEDMGVRYAALKALGELNDPRAVPALIEFLRSNAKGRALAVETLGKIQDPRVGPALLEAVNDPERAVSFVAAVALGERKHPRAIPVLIKILEDRGAYLVNYKDSSVRCYAAWVLGEFKDLRAVPALIEALKYNRLDSTPLQIAAAKALGRICDLQAIPALNKASKDSDASVRSAAAEALKTIMDSPEISDHASDKGETSRLDDQVAQVGRAEVRGKSDPVKVFQAVYSEKTARYLELLRSKLFSDQDSLALLLPAGGADIATALALNATDVVVPDQLSLGDERDTHEDHRFRSASYFEKKKQDSWSFGGDLSPVLMPFIAEELRRLGIRKWKVELLSDKNHLYRLTFSWAFPGELPKQRTFTYIGEVDLRNRERLGQYSEEWTSFLPAGKRKFDAMLFKGQMYLLEGKRQSYFNIAKHRAFFDPLFAALKNKGIVVSDVPVSARAWDLKPVQDPDILAFEKNESPKLGYGPEVLAPNPLASLRGTKQSGVYLYRLAGNERSEVRDGASGKQVSPVLKSFFGKMTLQKKTLMAGGLAIGVFLCTIGNGAYSYIHDSYLKLEKVTVQENTGKAKKIFDARLESLENSAKDWGQWDEPYAAMKDLNGPEHPFIKANLMDSRFSDLNLNLIVFLKPSGEVAFAKNFDLKEKKEVSLPKDLKDALSCSESFLRAQTNINASAGGVVLMDGQGWFLVSHSILTAEGKGPSAGTLVFGLKLDPNQLGRIGVDAYSKITAYPWGAEKVSAEFQEARSRLEAGEQFYVAPQDDKTVSGYFLLKDTSGKPSLMLRADFPRPIHEAGHSSALLLSLSLLLAGLTFGGLSLFLLHKGVLNRLSRLSSDIDKIGTSEDSAKRVSLEGSDELSDLANRMNHMLGQIEHKEAALQSKTALLEAQTDSTLDGILVVDENGKRVLTNQRIIKLFNIPQHIVEDADDAALLKHVVSLTKDPEKFLEKVMYLYAHPNEISRDEIEFKNGMILERYSAPVLDKDGKNYGRIWTFHDITDRKKVEDQLRVSTEIAQKERENFLQIFEAAPVGLFLLDADAMVLGANKAITNILLSSSIKSGGLGIGGVLGCVHSQVSPKGCGFGPGCLVCPLRKGAEKVLAGGAGIHGAEINPTLIVDGKPLSRWLNINVEPVEIAGERKVIVSVADISQSKQREEAISQAKDESEKAKAAAEQANKFKSRFLANMSHEIRTPLNPIVGFLGMIMERLRENGHLTPDIEKWFGIINSSAEHLLALINDVLEVSKIESGQLQLASNPVSIRKLVTETFEALSLKASSKNINYQLVSPLSDEVHILGDNLRIRQVVINLLNNALKFTPANEGPGTNHAITLSLDIRPAGSQENIVISVKDTGAGIAQEELKNLFKEFAQTRSGKRQDVNEGTGLGLALSRKLAQAMGGDITVESQVGLGSTFTFTFPAHRTQSEVKPREVLSKGALVEIPEDLNIVIAEDDATNQMIMSAYLKRNKPLVVNDGLELMKELLTRASDHQPLPGVILLDMQMPNLSGLEFLKLLAGASSEREGLINSFPELKKEGREFLKNIPEKDFEAFRGIPIIMQTANVLDNESKKCLELGAKGFISKPVKKTELFSLINQLARKPVAREVGAPGERPAAEGATVRTDASSAPMASGVARYVSQSKSQTGNEGEERYRRLADDMPVYIATFLPDGTLTYTNAALSVVAGDAPEKLIGSNFFDVLAPGNRKEAIQQLELLTLDHSVRTYEQVGTTPDGRTLWHQWTIRAFFDNVGRAIRFQAVGLDITERKKVEMELRAANEKIIKEHSNFVKIFGLVPVGILLLDSDTVVREANEIVANLTLSSATKLIGKRGGGALGCIHSLENPKGCGFGTACPLCPLRRGIESVLASGQSIHGAEVNPTLLIGGKPQPRWLSVNAEPIEIDGKKHVVVSLDDITDRKKAESEREFLLVKVRESEEKHRLLIENSHDIIYTLTADGVFTFVSPAWTALLGQPATQIVGQSFQRFVHPEDIPGCLAWLRKVIETGQRQEGIEYRVRHADGSWRWHTSSAVPLRDKTGAVVGFEGTARDITARKQAVEQLREATERLTLAAQAGGVGIWDYDMVNNRLIWDDQMYRLYGITADKFSGAYEAWQAGVHPEDRQRGDEEIQLALQGEKDFDTEFRVLWPDGTTHNIRALAHVQRDPSGKPLRMVGTNWDITERKKKDVELRESEERMQFALEISRIGAWDLDLVNHTAFRTISHDNIFGYQTLLPQWTYEMFFEHVLPDDRTEVDRKFRIATEKKTDWGFEARIRRTDGEVRWIWAAGRHVMGEDAKTKRMAGIVQDITERKEDEKKLQENHALLSALTEQAPGALYQFKLSPEGRFSLPFASASFAQSFGISPELLQADTTAMFNTIHPEDLERVTTSIQESARTLNLWSQEFRVVFPNGDIFWRLARSKPERLSDGSILWHGFISDITERKKSEGVLRDSEFFFKESQRAAAVGSFKTNFTTGRWETSEAFNELFGIKGKFEWSVQGWLELVHPEDREMMSNYLAESVIKRRESFDREYRILRKPDGSTRWVRASGRPYDLDPEGNVISIIGTLQDITARKQAEAETKESEERFKNLFELHSAVMLLIEPSSGLILDANVAAEKFYGYSKSVLRAKHINEINQLTADEVKAERERAVKAERNYFVFPHRLANGVTRIVEVHSSPIDFHGKKVLFSIIHDITDRKKAEEAQKESEAIFSQFMAHSPVHIYIKDEKLRLVKVSRNLKDLLGKSAHELIGKDSYDLLPREFAEKAIADDQKVLEEGVVVSRKEELHGRTYLTTKFPIRREAGKEEYLAGFSVDITDRKRSEENLRESEKKNRELMAQLPVPVMAHDASRNIVCANGEAAKLFGYPVEALLKMSFDALEAPEFAAQARERLMEQRKVGFWRGQGSYHDRDGRRFKADVLTMRNTEGLTIVVMNDLTQQIASVKDSVVSDALHDLNNARAAAYATIPELCEIYLESGQQSGGVFVDFEHLKGLAQSTQAVDGIIKRLWSEVKGQAVFNHEIIALGDLAKIINGYRLAIYKKGELDALTIIIENDAETIPVYVDRDSIEQIVLNLIKNAKKAGGAGPIEVRLRKKTLGAEDFDEKYVMPFVDKQGGRNFRPGSEVAEIVVSDQGPGMNESLRSKIGERGYTTGADGTGLGLHSSMFLAKKLGGDLELITKEGQGTTFELRLKVSDKKLTEGVLVPDERTARGLRVLVIDDREGPRQIITNYLQGFRIKPEQITAPARYTDLLELLVTKGPKPWDIVISDQNLDQLSEFGMSEPKLGTDLIAQFRQVPGVFDKKTAIVFASAAARDHDRGEILRLKLPLIEKMSGMGPFLEILSKEFYRLHPELIATAKTITTPKVNREKALMEEVIRRRVAVVEEPEDKQTEKPQPSKPVIRILFADDEESSTALMTRSLKKVAEGLGASGNMEVQTVESGEAVLDMVKERPGYFDAIILDNNFNQKGTKSGVETGKELKEQKFAGKVFLLSGMIPEDAKLWFDGMFIKPADKASIRTEILEPLLEKAKARASQLSEADAVVAAGSTAHSASTEKIILIDDKTLHDISNAFSMIASSSNLLVNSDEAKGESQKISKLSEELLALVRDIRILPREAVVGKTGKPLTAFVEKLEEGSGKAKEISRQLAGLTVEAGDQELLKIMAEGQAQLDHLLRAYFASHVIRILFADDDKDISSVFALLVRSSNPNASRWVIKADIVGSGEEALKKIDENGIDYYDSVILDNAFGVGISGLKLGQILKDEEGKYKYKGRLVLSSGEEHEGTGDWFDGVLSKPFTGSDLTAAAFTPLIELKELQLGKDVGRAEKRAEVRAYTPLEQEILSELKKVISVLRGGSFRILSFKTLNDLETPRQRAEDKWLELSGLSESPTYFPQDESPSNFLHLLYESEDPSPFLLEKIAGGILKEVDLAIETAEAEFRKDPDAADVRVSFRELYAELDAFFTGLGMRNRNSASVLRSLAMFRNRTNDMLGMIGLPLLGSVRAKVLPAKPVRKSNIFVLSGRGMVFVSFGDKRSDNFRAFSSRELVEKLRQFRIPVTRKGDREIVIARKKMLWNDAIVLEQKLRDIERSAPFVLRHTRRSEARAKVPAVPETGAQPFYSIDANQSRLINEINNQLQTIVAFSGALNAASSVTLKEAAEKVALSSKKLSSIPSRDFDRRIESEQARIQYYTDLSHALSYIEVEGDSLLKVPGKLGEVDAEHTQIIRDEAAECQALISYFVASIQAKIRGWETTSSKKDVRAASVRRAEVRSSQKSDGMNGTPFVPVQFFGNAPVAGSPERPATNDRIRRLPAVPKNFKTYLKDAKPRIGEFVHSAWPIGVFADECWKGIGDARSVAGALDVLQGGVLAVQGAINDKGDIHLGDVVVLNRAVQYQAVLRALIAQGEALQRKIEEKTGPSPAVPSNRVSKPAVRAEVRVTERLDIPQMSATDTQNLWAKLGTAVQVASNTVSPLLSSTPAYASEIAPKLFGGTSHYQKGLEIPLAFATQWPVFYQFIGRSMNVATERLVIDQRQGVPDVASVLPLVTFALYNPKVSVVLALIADKGDVDAFVKKLSKLSPNFKVQAFASENDFVGAFAGFYNSAAPLGRSVALITDREDSAVTRKIGSRRHLLSVVGAQDPLKQTASALLAADKLLDESIWSLGYHFVSVEKLGGLEALMAELTSYLAGQRSMTASA